MPKPFLVGLEIEETSFGTVMRKLDGLPGVVKIHWNMDRDKAARGKPNGSSQPRAARGVYEGTGTELVERALFAKAPQTNAQLREYFIAEKRSGHSVNSILHNMKKAGEVTANADGAYSLTKKARDRLRHRIGKKKR